MVKERLDIASDVKNYLEVSFIGEPKTFHQNSVRQTTGGTNEFFQSHSARH